MTALQSTSPLTLFELHTLGGNQLHTNFVLALWSCHNPIHNSLNPKTSSFSELLPLNHYFFLFVATKHPSFMQHVSISIGAGYPKQSAPLAQCVSLQPTPILVKRFFLKTLRLFYITWCVSILSYLRGSRLEIQFLGDPSLSLQPISRIHFLL